MMHPLVALAHAAVTEHVLRGKVIPPPGELTPEMKERAGVFVCIKKEGELRGCIGTFAPCYGSVAEEVIHNAIAAATGDPRFYPVGEEELPSLVCTVDVLSPPEKISGPAELDVKKYGVIVASAGRRGLLLPDIEGVETVDEQIGIARMKAGIARGEDVEIYRFEVRRHQ